jgi:hypothetical protein
LLLATTYSAVGVQLASCTIFMLESCSLFSNRHDESEFAIQCPVRVPKSLQLISLQIFCFKCEEKATPMAKSNI